MALSSGERSAVIGPSAQVASQTQSPDTQTQSHDEGYQSEKNTRSSKTLPYLIALATGIIVAFVVVEYVFRYRCTKCHSWLSTEKVNSEYLGSEVVTYTTTEAEQHKDSDGRLIKTVERPVQRQKTVRHYRYSYKCKKCGYQSQRDVTS